MIDHANYAFLPKYIVFLYLSSKAAVNRIEPRQGTDYNARGRKIP